MLLELIAGSERSEFVLIVDSLAQPGRALLKSLMRGAALRGETVHVFHWEMSRSAVSAGLVPDIASRLVHHDCFSDPLGWTGSGALIPETLTAPDFPHAHGVIDLRAAVGGASGPDRWPLCVVLDSLSPLLLHAGWPRVLSRLRALADRRHDDGVQVRQVVALLHGDAHAEGTTADAVRHAASTVLTLTSAPPRAFPHVPGSGSTSGSGQAAPQSCFDVSVLHKRRSGKVVRLDERMAVVDGFESRLIADGARSSGATTANSGEAPVCDPTAELTFNLRLTEDERKARDRVALPYQLSAQQKQDLLTPGVSASPTQIGGGRIFYCPDDADDIDDEDPDDDLDI